MSSSSVDKTFIYISSIDRLGAGTNSEFRVSLTQSINNVRKITLEAASIPYSWYNVRTTSYVPLKETGQPFVAVYLPPAMYTPTSLATALATALTAASPSLSTYTVTYDSATGKFTISSTIGFELQFLTYRTDNYMAFYLGFQYPSVADTGFALTHTSTGVARFTDEFLVLKISPIGSNYRSSDQFVGGSTLAMIPVQGNAFDTILYTTNSYYEQSVTFDVSGHNFRDFVVQLQFVDGTAVPLNGNPISLILSYTEHPPKNRISNIEYGYTGNNPSI